MQPDISQQRVLKNRYNYVGFSESYIRLRARGTPPKLRMTPYIVNAVDLISDNSGSQDTLTYKLWVPENRNRVSITLVATIVEQNQPAFFFTYGAPLNINRNTLAGNNISGLTFNSGRSNVLGDEITPPGAFTNGVVSVDEIYVSTFFGPYITPDNKLSFVAYEGVLAVEGKQPT